MAKKQRLEIGNDIINFGGEIEADLNFEDSFESDRRHQEAEKIKQKKTFTLNTRRLRFKNYGKI